MVCTGSHGNPHPVLFGMLSQETTENIKWILELLQYYASDAFGRVETVLMDKDYREIKALSLMMPNA